MNKKKLAIITLGRPNSGKSSTWYEFFGKVIRTGWKTIYINKQKLEIYVRNSSFEETNDEIGIDIFVRNSSFEEYGDEPETFFDDDNLPEILFCSVQYIKKGICTIQWLVDHGYSLYIQWLNPGFKDATKYDDFLKFEEAFSMHGIFLTESGKEKANRLKKVNDYLAKWIFDNK